MGDSLTRIKNCFLTDAGDCCVPKKGYTFIKSSHVVTGELAGKRCSIERDVVGAGE